MEKWIYRILCILTMLVFALIFIQEKTHFVCIKPLGGVVDEVSYPRITMNSYSDMSYQKNLEKYAKQNFGFREWLIRCYNQYLWDVFRTTNLPNVSIGKDGWLYEPWFVDDYYHGLMFNDDPELFKDILRTEAVRLYKLQELLKNLGITLFVMVEPGKDRVYPEHLPEKKYYKGPEGVKAADYYPYLFDSLGVNYVDFSKYFVEQKGKVDYPLFPQTGTHWSNIAAVHVADSLIRYMEAIGKMNINNIEIGTPYCDTSRKPDDDLELMLNLIREIPKEPNMYADVSVVDDTSASRPKFLINGDSFAWNIINQVYMDAIFSKWQYWYYNSTIYKNPDYNSTSDVDYAAEILGSDYIMLSYCTAMIYGLGYGFIPKALVHLCYDDRQIDAVRNNIIASMKGNEEWMAYLINKAKEEGRDLDDVMYEDATDNLFTRIEVHFPELAGEGIPPVRRDICVEHIKSDIYSVPEWICEVRRQAEEWNVPLDTAVTRNAIWYYNQHKSEY